MIDLPTPGHVTLRYRPPGSPTLVSTPEELADQLRLHWAEATRALDNGVDERMATLLTTKPGTDAALAVLRSNQSGAAKLVLLQGLLDPEQTIQFQGTGLDDASIWQQIHAARQGDGKALNWLASLRGDGALTAFAEITGSDHAAEADFYLELWDEQAHTLFHSVTMSPELEKLNFKGFRSKANAVAASQAKINEYRETLAGLKDREFAASLESGVDELERSSTDAEFGEVEDWFFDETRRFMLEQFRAEQTALLFTAAFTQSGVDTEVASAVHEVRVLASKSSVDPSDYWPKKHTPHRSSASNLKIGVPPTAGDRLGRITQAVSQAVKAVDQATDEDLGTIFAAGVVLAHASKLRCSRS